METVARTQTAFRLKDSLVDRLKWYAKRNHQSLNSFVEETLERTVGSELQLPQFSPEDFAQARSFARRFVLPDASLPETYQGLDAFGQAEVDKELLKGKLYEG